MKRRLSNLCSLVILSLLTACQDYDFGYKSYEPDVNETKYSRRFANRDDIDVNIVTETPGAPYFVYFCNPYNADGSFNGATAYLQGITPLRTKLSVPRHVDSLYVVSPMREMRVFPSGDLAIEDQNLCQPASFTRVNIDKKPYALTDVPAYLSDLNNGSLQPHYYLSSDPNPSDDMPLFNNTNPDVTDDLINYTNSVFQPGVVDQSSLTKTTDLSFKSENNDDYVAVWVTLLGHGAGDPNAAIWFYIYEDSDTGPQAGDVQMLGFDSNNNLIATDLNKGKPSQGNSLFNLNEQNTASNPYPTVFIGYVKSGYNIGFCYQELGGNGQNAKIRFTTPTLNGWAVGGAAVSGGFIVNRELGQHSYNIVGIEKYPGQRGTGDNDFNDALLLVETNPEIKPKEEIEIKEVKEEIKRTKGYYLFEDLYEPGKAVNDNDFNDVVLYYERVDYKITYGDIVSYSCDFSAEKLANGCDNINEVGIYHRAGEKEPKKYVLYEGVTGQENMEGPVGPFDHSGKKAFSFLMSSANDVILPYLRTTAQEDGALTPYDPTDPNKGNIYPTTYQTKDFPYAMEIPFVEGKPFRWMQEGICITEGYDWSKTSDTWYTAPTNPDKLVPRATDSTY